MTLSLSGLRNVSRPMIFTFDFQQSSPSCYCLRLLDEKTEAQRVLKICSQTWGQQMLQLEELRFWHSKKHFYQMCEPALQYPTPVALETLLEHLQ